MPSLPLPTLLCAAMWLVCQAVQGREPTSTPAEATRILDRMREVYSNCATYRDEGRVEIEFVREGTSRKVVKDFKTAFVRPDRFYFEYSQHDVFEVDRTSLVLDDRYVLWWNEAGASTWWTVNPKIRHWATLKDAVSAARGVSSVASTRVSSLLIPEIQWEDLLRVESATVVGEESLDGAGCWRIEARAGDRSFHVWIDQEQYLLRRVHRERDIASAEFTTRTTTTYRPRINIEIPPTQFEFIPPEGLRGLGDSLGIS